MDEVSTEVTLSLEDIDMEDVGTEITSNLGGLDMEAFGADVTDCNSYVLDSTTLLATPSSPQKIEAKNKGLYGKIPVTISQPKVQIYVEAGLRLPHSALAVTNVSKNVILTRSQLMPTDDKKSAKLLLNGFVRKTIQFAVPSNRSNQGISGDIRFSTFDIPFKCFAKVDYLIEPDFSFDESSRAINIADSCYFGADTSQYAFVNSQFLNERISVELLAATIRDIGRKGDLCNFRDDTDRSLFRVIDESMVVELVLRVTQNQLVEVPASGGSGGSGGSGSNGGGGKGNNDGKGNKNDNGGNNCKGDKDDNHGNNCKGDKDNNHGHNCNDDKDDNHGHSCKDGKDDDHGHNCNDDKDDNHGHNCKGDKDNKCSKDKNDDLFDSDQEYGQKSKYDDYKEIGELKLSVPTKLLDQIKKHIATRS